MFAFEIKMLSRGMYFRSVGSRLLILWRETKLEQKRSLSQIVTERKLNPFRHICRMRDNACYGN